MPTPIPHDRSFDHADGGETTAPRADAVLAGLAARQHGVVSRRQLVRLGVSPRAIDRRIEAGRLVALHRGVYAVGHARLARDGFWMAAVLAAGPGAVLSHRDAAALHGLRPTGRPSIDVACPAKRRSTDGIRIHRTVLTPVDVTAVDGIPVTTVARTLVDLAGVVARQSLATALAEADVQRTLDVRALEAAMARTRGRRGPGHARLRAVLAEHAAMGATRTRSELERTFLALVERHGLPRPRVNAHVAGFEVDAWFPDAALAVELDGHAFHRTRAAMRRDRRQDRALLLAGVRVMRFTHDEVVRDAARVAAEVRAALRSA